jgi:hypothetical protein
MICPNCGEKAEYVGPKFRAPKSDIVKAWKSIEVCMKFKKKEYLDTLKLLSEEALKLKDKRLPYTTLKTIIKYSLGTLNAVSSMINNYRH